MTDIARHGGHGRAVLVVAYHFPPIQASSGIHRTLGFTRYLPDHGWQPVVLTARESLYERWSPENYPLIPEGVEVVRARGWDATRDLSIGGRYLGLTALPDRWASWLPHAIVQGLRAVRRFRPRVIVSTYPIATAHLIGWALHRLSGLPWVADFRDPMAQDEYPADRATWRAFRWIENRAVARAARLVFTAPRAVEYYRRRFPQLGEGRAVLIENGFDEALFEGLATRAHKEGAAHGPRVLLHSGIVYPSERDPSQLFAALGRLRGEGVLTPGLLRVRFRAAGNEARYRRMAVEAGAGDLIEFMPPVSYSEALCEMAQADGLLVLQAANCNFQIPAKVYEYLRIGRPVVGLCDPEGDTAAVLRRAGLDTIAPLDSADAIAALLRRFVEGWDTLPRPDSCMVQQMTRRARTAELAHVLDEVAQMPAPSGGVEAGTAGQRSVH